MEPWWPRVYSALPGSPKKLGGLVEGQNSAVREQGLCVRGSASNEQLRGHGLQRSHFHGSPILHHAGHCAAYLERLVRTLASDAAVSQAAGMWKDTRTVMTGCAIVSLHAPAILTLLVRTRKSRHRSRASARAGIRRVMVCG